jgi:hypothetical protein
MPIGFVEELGQDIDSILENKLEDDRVNEIDGSLMTGSSKVMTLWVIRSRVRMIL